MRKPEVSSFFAKLIQRTSPKSYAQAMGELVVTRKFFENFSGDQVRGWGLEIERAACRIVCSAVSGQLEDEKMPPSACCQQ